ncbi:MAG: hypothetical protein PHE27_04985 [Alphaproteobacteria bacterium]|nr:hypothetical protein [Alphaproteobacteria bacterium]
MKTFGKGIAVLCLVALTGCSELTAQEQRMLTGAAAGTAIGAAGTVMTGGCVACGAAIGGVVGTGAGYIVDQLKKTDQSSTGY